MGAHQGTAYEPAPVTPACSSVRLPSRAEPRRLPRRGGHRWRCIEYTPDRLLISEHLDIDARFVTSESHFIYDLGADFLDRIELMIAIEDRFDVEITDDDIEQFRVVGDLISHLARQQNAIGGAKPVP